MNYKRFLITAVPVVAARFTRLAGAIILAFTMVPAGPALATQCVWNKAGFIVKANWFDPRDIVTEVQKELVDGAWKEKVVAGTKPNARIWQTDEWPTGQGRCTRGEAAQRDLAAVLSVKDGKAASEFIKIGSSFFTAVYTAGMSVGIGAACAATAGGACALIPLAVAGGAAGISTIVATIPDAKEVFYIEVPSNTHYLDVWGTVWQPTVGPGGPIAPEQRLWSDGTFSAIDVAVGADGVLWYIGPDGSIYREGTKMPGGGVRIAVDPKGTPWVVNAGGQIFRWTGSAWQQMPGSAATDVGIGANGTVWVAGAGGVLFRWNPSTNSWVQLPSGAGVRVSVDRNGNPWVVNSSNQIWQHTGSAWKQLPGAGRDIGVGADGTVYVVGMGAVQGGSGVWRWIPSENSWTPEPGAAGTSVAAGPPARAFVARDSGLKVLKRNF